MREREREERRNIERYERLREWDRQRCRGKGRDNEVEKDRKRKREKKLDRVQEGKEDRTKSIKK